MPVAAITLLNDEKQWFKSTAGWAISELARRDSPCQVTVEENRLVTIANMAQDPRTEALPIVASTPRFRAYAGHPLVDEHGSICGTFCAFDIKPRELTPADRQTVTDLAHMVQRELLSDQLSDAHAELTSKLSAARREALMDPLTHLWNRRGANVLLTSALQKSDTHGLPLTLALLDLDHFKRINDRHGHQSGDEVLRKIAGRLLSSVRSEDHVCRFGGDEFFVLMSDTDSKLAARISERIRQAVTEAPVPTRDGPLPISVSIGFTVRQPNDPTVVEALIERADKALLQSKAAGRNRVRMVN
jgi:diguanylate cyclase (GGDEF)-like protein